MSQLSQSSFKDKFLEAIDTALALPAYTLTLLFIAPIWLADKLADILMPEQP